MPTLELKAVVAYLKETLSKRFIPAFLSSCAAPVLFVKKLDGGLRFCVDYRGLNDITVKNHFPLPLTHETTYRLRGACVFTQLNLRETYNLLRIKDGNE